MQMKISLKFERDKFANKFVTYCRLIDTGVYLSYIFYSMSVSARESEELHLQENIRIDPFLQTCYFVFFGCKSSRAAYEYKRQLVARRFSRAKERNSFVALPGKGNKKSYSSCVKCARSCKSVHFSWTTKLSHY